MSRDRLDVHTHEGAMDAHLFRPSGDGAWPAVIVYMDAYGLRPDLDVMGERLAAAGYVVAMPNLYYRTPFAPFDPAQVAAGGTERDRFMSLIRSIDGFAVMRDTEALLAQLTAERRVRPGPIGVVGYCMGGGYALRAAAVFGDRVAAAASFHGGSLATDRPDSPHTLAPQMRGRIYVGVAGIDAGFSDEQRVRLESALRAAGVAFEIETYEGAQHGFAVHNHRVYDHAAAERHWARLGALLDATLRAPASLPVP